MRWGCASTGCCTPKRRAVQTAELLAPLCDGELELTSTPLLARHPGVELWEMLEGEHLAVVGHEPHLSALLSWLVTGEDTGGPSFELKKGAVAQLEGDPGPGGMRLRAILPPKVLCR